MNIERLTAPILPSENLSKARSILIAPLLIILATISFHLIFNRYLITHSLLTKYVDILSILENVIYNGIIALSFFWLINNLINQLIAYILSSDYSKSHHILSILILSLTKIIKGIAFIIIFKVFIKNVYLPEEFSYFLDKISSILIIAASGWILFQIINSSEQLILQYYSQKTATGFNKRKIHTQLLIVKRIAVVITGILVAGSILMLFDSVKALGASVLTTAGIIGLVMTFTAQKALGNLFSGLEIALTQPIKIGDTVVIENEFGVIEEINFRNVIIKLWDWRRLIVPTNYFLEKSFENWSREESNNLIGSVYLYVDYTLPVEELRNELNTILAKSPFWDSNINTIQVTDLQDKVMQLRVLCSANSPSKTWDLRCEVREKLISFITKNYPDSLPVSRSRTFKEI